MIEIILIVVLTLIVASAHTVIEIKGHERKGKKLVRSVVLINSLYLLFMSVFVAVSILR